MTKIMLVSLLFAACTTNVKNVHCETSGDCVAGESCELDIQECIAGAITIDASAFYDDGSRWWTATDGPLLQGTIDAASGATLQAYLGDQQVGAPAAITDKTWTLQLPPGTIGTADTVVTLKLATGSAQAYELAQTFAYDASMPAIQVIGGSVHDERGDVIDFSSGQPVHTHAGPAVTLGGSDCPALDIYTYLTDDPAPLYGSEVTPNPLAVQFAVQEATKLDDTGSAYRVRADANNAVLLDWTSLATPDATGAYTVTLHRNAIPKLDSVSGKIFIDVRFRDWAGRETEASVCWTHHPLAAPLAIAAPMPGELFGMSLPAHSALSELLNLDDAPVSIVTGAIVQMTAEPITLAVATDPVTGTSSATWVTSAVVVATSTDQVACYFNCSGGSCIGASGSGPQCTASPLPAATTTASTGALGGLNSMTSLIDDSTGQAMALDAAGNYQIPPRRAGEEPHAYHFAYAIDGVTNLGDGQLGYGEYALGSVSYTGVAPGAVAYHCNHLVYNHNLTGRVEGSCTSWSEYQMAAALDKATLTFGAITTAFAASSDPALAPTPLTYLPNSAVSTSALAWDAGDAGLD